MDIHVLWKDDDMEIARISNKFKVNQWLPQETILGNILQSNSYLIRILTEIFFKLKLETNSIIFERSPLILYFVPVCNSNFF